MVVAIAMLLAIAALFMPPVQKWARDTVASTLSDATGCRVDIGSLRLFPFSTLKISEVDIYDPDSIKMLGLSSIKADISISSLWHQQLIISQIEADSIYANIRRRGGKYNIEHIITSAPSDTMPRTAPSIIIKALLTQNGIVTIERDSARSIQLRDIGIDISDISTSANGISASVNKANATYGQNKLPAHVECRIAARNDSICVTALKAMYGQSVIESDTARYSSASGRPTADIDIKLIYLSADELAALTGCRINANIAASGRIESDGRNIYLTDTRISNGRSTEAEVTGYIRNIDTPDRCDVGLALKRLATTPSDIELMTGRPLPIGTDGAATIGTIDLNASISGSLRDLSLSGTLTSGMGRITLSGSAQERTDGLYWLTANAQSDRIDLTPLLPQSPLSTLAIDINGNGQISTTNHVSYAHLSGTISDANINGYSYSDITFDAVAEGNDFSGVATVDDPNGSMTVVYGMANEQGTQHYTLTAKIDSLHTGELKLTPHIPNGNLTVTLGADIRGNDIDDATGHILVKDLTFRGERRTAHSDQIDITLSTDSIGSRRIAIASKLIDGTITGRFRFADIGTLLHGHAHGVADAIFAEKPRALRRDAHMRFDLNYHNADAFMQFASDKMTSRHSGHIWGHVSSAEQNAELNAAIGNIGYNGIELDTLHLTLRSTPDDMRLSLSTQQMTIPAMGIVRDAEIHSTLADNTMSNAISWYNSDLEQQSAILSEAAFERHGGHVTTDIQISPSAISLGQHRWRLNATTCHVEHNRFSIAGFKISHHDRYLAIDGEASAAEPERALTIRLNKLPLDDIIDNNENNKFTLSGDLSSTIELSNIYNSAIVAGYSSIDSLYVNGDRLDRMDVATEWQPTDKRLNIDLSIITDSVTRARGIGHIDNRNNQMRLDFDIDSLSIGFLNHYLKSPIRHIGGTTSGWLALHGPLSDIALDARLCVHKSKFTVRKTNVDYIFDHNDSIILSPTNMEFCNLRFTDRYGKHGYFGGNIRHNMFSGLRLNLTFRTIDQMVLETTSADNATYYGTIFADGLLRVGGSTSNVTLSVDAATSDNTVFHILPLEKSELSEKGYIQFVSRGDDKPSVDIADLLSGVSADINVNIRPNARIYAIIDPRTNNRISATGQGRLRLEVKNDGDLTLNGEYEIADGDYNFSFENIINKRFIINQGSTILWNGDPYNAQVNLMATYKLKASLYDLVANTGDATNADLKRRVPINCNLYLTEQLLDPNIRFDIEIPSTMNFNQYTFDQYVNTEEEMNRQVFSLLLANRFYAIQDASTSNTTQNTGSAYLGTTASELLSNQISNWMSQNGHNIGVGVNYRPGDEVTNEEYEVAVSTQVLDNKIILSGNIGYGRNATEASDGNLIGDFDVEVKLTPSGNLRAKAYTHSNNDVIYETSPTTQGVGLSFHEEFNTFGELLRKYWDIISGKRRRERRAAQQADTQDTDQQR